MLNVFFTQKIKAQSGQTFFSLSNNISKFFKYKLFILTKFDLAKFPLSRLTFNIIHTQNSKSTFCFLITNFYVQLTIHNQITFFSSKSKSCPHASSFGILPWNNAQVLVEKGSRWGSKKKKKEQKSRNLLQPSSK